MIVGFVALKRRSPSGMKGDYTDMTVHVNLWDPSPTDSNPHGVVHIGCAAALNPRRPDKWREAESVEAADRMFPSRNLYWCGRLACFGPNNPRPVPRFR